jgi:flagellar protein FlaF
LTALNLARNAYSAAAAPVRTDRGIEYDAFARITHRLKAAALSLGTDYPGFVSALHKNRQLWRLLATDIADSENALPKELRAQLFYLAEFTDHHTSLVLNDGARPDILIELNTSIMQGLRNQGHVQ